MRPLWGLRIAISYSIVAVEKRGLQADDECIKKAQYSNAHLTARLFYLFPVRVELIRWERQLLSRSKAGDMPRWCHWHEGGAAAAEAKAVLIGALWWFWMKGAWLILGGWFYCFEFSAWASDRFDWFILCWDTDCVGSQIITGCGSMDTAVLQWLSNSTKRCVRWRNNVRFEPRPLVPFVVHFVERDDRAGFNPAGTLAYLTWSA